jgi:hypothetical protein
VVKEPKLHAVSRLEKWFKKWRGIVLTYLAFCVSVLSSEYFVKRGRV